MSILQSEEGSWPDSLAFVKHLDGVLRCPVCFDYMQAPVLLPNCHHNFCSLCIRRYLVHKEQCPVCSSRVSSCELRSNHIMGTAIQHFKNMRQPLLELTNMNSVQCACSRSAAKQATVSTEKRAESTHPKSAPVADFAGESPKPNLPVNFNKRKEHRERNLARKCVTNTLKGMKKSSEASEADDDSNSSDIEIISEESDSLTVSPLIIKANASLLQGSPTDSPKPKTVQSKLFTHMRKSDEQAESSVTEQSFVKPGKEGGSFKRLLSTKSNLNQFSPSSPSTHSSRGCGGSKLVKENGSCSPDPHAPSQCLTTSDGSPEMQVPSPLLSPHRCSISKKEKSFSPASVPSGEQGKVTVTESQGSSMSEASPSGKASSPLLSLGKKHNEEKNASSPGTSRGDKVPCPVCFVPVLESAVNRHLDLCLAGSERKASMRPAERKKPLPKLVYNLMPDKDIRKRLKELGLNTQGDRQTLIKRHHDFTLFHNADCDSTSPKDMSVLIKEFEETQGLQKKLSGVKSSSNQSILRFTKDSKTEDIEEAKKKYELQHKKHFKALIKDVKERMKAAKEKQRQTASSTDSHTSTTDLENPAVTNFGAVSVDEDDVVTVTAEVETTMQVFEVEESVERVTGDGGNVAVSSDMNTLDETTSDLEKTSDKQACQQLSAAGKPVYLKPSSDRTDILCLHAVRSVGADESNSTGDSLQDNTNSLEEESGSVHTPSVEEVSDSADKSVHSRESDQDLLGNDGDESAEEMIQRTVDDIADKFVPSGDSDQDLFGNDGDESAGEMIQRTVDDKDTDWDREVEQASVKSIRLAAATRAKKRSRHDQCDEPDDRTHESIECLQSNMEVMVGATRQTKKQKLSKEEDDCSEREGSTNDTIGNAEEEPARPEVSEFESDQSLEQTRGTANTVEELGDNLEKTNTVQAPRSASRMKLKSLLKKKRKSGFIFKKSVRFQGLKSRAEQLAEEGEVREELPEDDPSESAEYDEVFETDGSGEMGESETGTLHVVEESSGESTAQKIQKESCALIAMEETSSENTQDTKEDDVASRRKKRGRLSKVENARKKKQQKASHTNGPEESSKEVDNTTQMACSQEPAPETEEDLDEDSSSGSQEAEQADVNLPAQSPEELRTIAHEYAEQTSDKLSTVSHLPSHFSGDPGFDIDNFQAGLERPSKQKKTRSRRQKPPHSPSQNGTEHSQKENIITLSTVVEMAVKETSLIARQKSKHENNKTSTASGVNIHTMAHIQESFLSPLDVVADIQESVVGTDDVMDKRDNDEFSTMTQKDIPESEVIVQFPAEETKLTQIKDPLQKTSKSKKRKEKKRKAEHIKQENIESQNSADDFSIFSNESSETADSEQSDEVCRSAPADLKLPEMEDKDVGHTHIQAEMVSKRKRGVGRKCKISQDHHSGSSEQSLSQLPQVFDSNSAQDCIQAFCSNFVENSCAVVDAGSDQNMKKDSLSAFDDVDKTDFKVSKSRKRAKSDSHSTESSSDAQDPVLTQPDSNVQGRVSLKGGNRSQKYKVPHGRSHETSVEGFPQDGTSKTAAGSHDSGKLTDLNLGFEDEDCPPKSNAFPLTSAADGMETTNEGYLSPHEDFVPSKKSHSKVTKTRKPLHRKKALENDASDTEVLDHVRATKVLSTKSAPQKRRRHRYKYTEEVNSVVVENVDSPHDSGDILESPADRVKTKFRAAKVKGKTMYKL